MFNLLFSNFAIRLFISLLYNLFGVFLEIDEFEIKYFFLDEKADIKFLMNILLFILNFKIKK